MFLPGRRNADTADLARSATITSSGNATRGDAAQVTDGNTREYMPALGPWADGATHRWESTALPAWIELTWPATQSLAEIHLTFDSGFERELTLSASDHTTRKIIRGPQPELVRDYDLLLDDRTLVKVTGNHLRKRVHRLPATVSGRRLRLVVHSTHGVNHARVFEIRAYGA